MRIRLVLAFFALVCSSLLHALITIEQIESKPLSRARDFMIWEFLQQQKVKPCDARRAFALLQNPSNLKIKKLYAKIVDDEVRFELACKKRKKLLSIEDDKCLRYAFSPYKTLHLSRFERDRLIVRELTKKQKELLRLQNEPYSLQRYRMYNPYSVISFMLSLPKKSFKRHLNIPMDREFLEFLSLAPNFDAFIAFVVSDYGLENIHRSLLKLELQKASSQTWLFLALNALRMHDTHRALELLESSKKAAKSPMARDRATFWLYLVTHRKSYLEELLLSMSINIYTQYAHEKLDVDIENYFSELVSIPRDSDYDLRDPFEWLSILQNIKSTPNSKLFHLVERYRYRNLLPVQRFILERAYNYKMHGYIMPYDKYLTDADNNEKALVYSIMRRESNYIPSGISRSFALGLMQLMPFLVDHLAKKKAQTIKSYSEMFEPKKNIEYARMHLRWLRKVLHENPLFVAYAYNGGYGFFSRYKKSGRFTDAEYEPFLSMEMMKNAESREYGKHVLSNYVMYKKLYKEPFSIIEFFETLKEPSHR